MTFEFQPSFGDQYWASLAALRHSPLQMVLAVVFPLFGIFLVVSALMAKTATISVFIEFPFFLAFTPIMTAVNVWLYRVGGFHFCLLTFAICLLTCSCGIAALGRASPAPPRPAKT